MVKMGQEWNLVKMFKIAKNGKNSFFVKMTKTLFFKQKSNKLWHFWGFFLQFDI